MIRLFAVLFFGCISSQAQTITETFGSGANQFQIEFVTIGNPGNAADTSGTPNPAGSVEYIYNLGKYEVSRDMITQANLAGGLNITMTDMSSLGGNGGARPANGISWYEAARFVNWLNTSTGRVGAYKFDANGAFQLWSPGDAGFNTANPYRNALASYWLPNLDEWYKAAYGSPGGGWYNFPNGSDVQPSSAEAVYGQLSGDPSETGPADVGQAGAFSSWGTMGQGGNVAEWMENAFDRSNDSATENREVRGGAWVNFPSYMGSALADQSQPDREYLHTSGDGYLGFRVAGVPEPSSISLLLAGGAVLIRMRAKVSLKKQSSSG